MNTFIQRLQTKTKQQTRPATPSRSASYAGINKFESPSKAGQSRPQTGQQRLAAVPAKLARLRHERVQICESGVQIPKRK